MTNGQAFSTLLQIQRSNPELSAVVQSVMDYITDLSAVAGLASDNLTLAARELPRNPVIQQNAGIVSDTLATLITPSPSHGEDI